MICTKFSHETRARLFRAVAFAIAVAAIPPDASAAPSTPPATLYDVTTLWAGSATNYTAGMGGAYAGFMAFDNGSKTDSYRRWITTKSANMYVTYTFNEATPIDAIGIYMGVVPGRAPKDWTFSGSNDNSTWTTLDTQTDETNWSAYEFRYYKFVNDTPYRYYKFNCTANNGDSSYMEVQELEFYNDLSVPPTGGEVDLTTSAAGYVNGQSGNYAGYKADNAFDNFGNKSRTDSESRWLAAKSSNMYAIYRFSRPTAVDAIGIYLTADSTARAPKDWTFSGSNDKSTWTTLDARTGETGWKQFDFRYYKFVNDTPYTYYRFSCTANNGDANCMGIQEIEFYHSQSGPGTAKWTNAGETDLVTDAGNWNPALPRWATTAYIDDTGATPAVVPAGEIVYSGLVVGNGSGKSAKVAQTNGTVRLLDSVLKIGCEGGSGEYCISGGVLETKRLEGGNGTASAVFDGGVLRAMANNAAILKDIPDIQLKAGGITIDTQGYDLVIDNCVFNVTPGGKITVIGGGTVTFSNATIALTGGTSRAFTVAERADGGTFVGVPVLATRGCKLVVSGDRKTIRIVPLGLTISVR